MSESSKPIGLFDSGFGGLTILRELSQLLPAENLIYLGDTAHLPYGNKSPEKIVQLAQNNAQFLLELQIKLLIIPCHTACSRALSLLQQTLPIPVIGVIESGLELLIPFKRIAILGTHSTIESGIYQSLIRGQNPHVQLFPIACPLFVPIIEEGFHNHPSAHLIAESYLHPLQGQIDAALLACTHYPLMKNTLQTVLGSHVQLIEPTVRCVQKAYNYLSTHHLLNPQKRKGSHQFYSTDAPEKFQQLGEIFLQSKIEKIAKI